jgi:hypothetical protein
VQNRSEKPVFQALSDMPPSRIKSTVIQRLETMRTMGREVTTVDVVQKARYNPFVMFQINIDSLAYKPKNAPLHDFHVHPE